jgi:hypothetical protein
MTNSRTYEGWWDLSLIDGRNERRCLRRSSRLSRSGRQRSCSLSSEEARLITELAAALLWRLAMSKPRLEHALVALMGSVSGPPRRRRRRPAGNEATRKPPGPGEEKRAGPDCVRVFLSRLTKFFVFSLRASGGLRRR